MGNIPTCPVEEYPLTDAVPCNPRWYFPLFRLKDQNIQIHANTFNLIIWLDWRKQIELGDSCHVQISLATPGWPRCPRCCRAAQKSGQDPPKKIFERAWRLHEYCMNLQMNVINWQKKPISCCHRAKAARLYLRMLRLRWVGSPANLKWEIHNQHWTLHIFPRFQQLFLSTFAALVTITAGVAGSPLSTASSFLSLLRSGRSPDP